MGSTVLPTQVGFARKFTLPQTTTVNKAKLYIASTASTATFGYLSVVIYKDASNVPDSSQVSCLATNQYFTLPLGLRDWKEFTLSNCTLEPGDYWLAFEKRVALDATS